MPKICYVHKKFNADHMQIIDRANQILSGFAAAGYDMTLRQLYYQFVTKNWLVNKKQNYNKLGYVISDARRAGLIDWDRISDRTRNVRSPTAWSGPAAIIKACAAQFDVDWWAEQPYRPEVWVEKDALIGVLEVACREWHCPYFSCRGYTSDSELWAAAQRMDRHESRDQIPIVFHLGDHDPSGIDMSRDISDRLRLFQKAVTRTEVRRLALTMDQVNQYGPPPNPAKETDCRFTEYRKQYGDESWELDALSPDVIGQLIADAMESILDHAAWEEAEQRRDEGLRLLQNVSDNWETITQDL